ncbi:hypothetical protein Cni_G25384 [Canna indica]|uniref:RING-type E3 ubiquitin transferase n=1 Tax=Canna indica TaxID=4628 RepID=A0AAQ3KZX3_9LILI|nr:hypothetical protein Cni_G25384 [Canna indica]
MEHKHFGGQPQVHVMAHEQLRNHPHPEPHFTLGHGPFMHPSEIIAVCGPNSMSYNIPSSTANYPALPNFNLEVPFYMMGHAGTAQQPYVHNSSAPSSSQFPPYHVQHEPYFNQLTTGDIGVVNHTTGFDTDTYKNRIPTTQNFVETRSRNVCHSAGSFSHATSTGLSLPWDPTSYRSNCLLSYEDEQRNIRSWHANILQPKNISLTIHSSNNFSDPLLVANTSCLSVPGQWNHAPSSLDPHIRLVSSDWPAHDVVAGHRTYGQGIGYRSNASYRSVGPEANLVDLRLPAPERVVPPRHSRQLTMIGHASERNGRVRTHEDIGNNSWVLETLTVMDRSTFYNSRNMFDEHQDMRLDIDNMSYEELLALEEHIGNVNTGLSEVAISSCMIETIYCSDQVLDDHHDHEEGRCIICLELYKDRDCLGRLNCGHYFHASCVKTWLLVKNACPICKAPALDDSIM